MYQDNSFENHRLNSSKKEKGQHLDLNIKKAVQGLSNGFTVSHWVYCHGQLNKTIMEVIQTSQTLTPIFETFTLQGWWTMNLILPTQMFSSMPG